MAKKKKTKTPKQFSCFIRWSSRSSQQDVCDVFFSEDESPRDANRYDFDTQKELDAFLYGVNEAEGGLE